jgi:outer membrane protein TolC
VVAGASAAETLIDFGARTAKVRQARAAYDGAVATYRQTVLNAFQEVETNLAAAGAYRGEAQHYTISAEAAGKAESITATSIRRARWISPR